MITQTSATLRSEVHKLAELAFHKNLISGYGDGEYENEYQIVLEGKPRHFSLEYAHEFLDRLIKESSLEN